MFFIHFVKKFISEATSYSAALMVALAIAYLFHILATRFLGIPGYAEFSKYFGILTFLIIPTNTIQSFVAREIVQGKNCSGYIMKKMIYILVPISIILLFLGNGYLVISLFIILYLLSIYRGLLQGEFKKLSLSLNLVLEAVFRISLLFVLIKIFNLGYIGALLSFGIAYFLVFIPGFKVKYGTEKIDLKPLISFIFASIIIFYPTSMTLYLSSYSLSDTLLSSFGIIILLSKFVIFVSLAIGMAYLPRAMKGDKIKNLLFSILALVIVSLPFVVYPKMFTVFFPKSYSTFLIDYLPLATVSMLLMGISYLIMNYFWSKKQDWYLIIPGIIYIILQTIFSFSKDLNLQIIGMLISSSILLILLFSSKFLKDFLNKIHFVS